MILTQQLKMANDSLPTRDNVSDVLPLEWTPKTLFNVGDSILCPVTYWVLVR